MGAEKTYAWERDKFPWHHRVNILPEYRREVTCRLAEAFGLRGIYPTFVTRGGGMAVLERGIIKLPRDCYDCALSTIVHEIAHHFDYKHFGGNGHRASFKKSLIKLMVEVRVYKMLIPIFAKIRQDAKDKAKASAAAAVSYSKKLQREADLAARRKTPAYKLEKVLVRAAILRTRIKRLSTALKKAERQAKAIGRRMAQPTRAQPAPGTVSFLPVR